jgi:hypothetical protein
MPNVAWRGKIGPADEVRKASGMPLFLAAGIWYKRADDERKNLRRLPP